MTTVGYGDIEIKSNPERIYAFLIMIIASGLYGYSLNKISTIILDMDSNNQNYKN